MRLSEAYVNGKKADMSWTARVYELFSCLGWKIYCRVHDHIWTWTKKNILHSVYFSVLLAHICVPYKYINEIGKTKTKKTKQQTCRNRCKDR